MTSVVNPYVTNKLYEPKSHAIWKDLQKDLDTVLDISIRFIFWNFIRSAYQKFYSTWRGKIYTEDEIMYNVFKNAFRNGLLVLACFWGF